MKKRKIVIIGSGPAGIATALSLRQISPHLASEVVILEREKHPRHKLCGGGLTPYADEILATLGVRSKVPSFPIHKVRFYFENRPVHFLRKDMMRVVRRDEFDADLVYQARAAGITILERQNVVDVRRSHDGLEVATERGTFYPRVIVGADGANSLVRKKMIAEKRSRVSRLMEVLVRVDPTQTQEFAENMAVLDFRPARYDLQGYLWNFPSLIQGQAYLNIGIFDSRIHGDRRAKLREFLTERLRNRGLLTENITFMGHPERWFSPKGRYACPNVLLVGDAAGIEPWLGEGISTALAYGPVAAEAVKKAFENDDFSFATYPKLVLKSRLGRFLRRNRIIAKYFYNRRIQSLLPLIAKGWETYFNLS